MVVGAILPSFNSSTVDVRGKRKFLIPRWADLDTVTIGERHREINYLRQLAVIYLRSGVSITLLTGISGVELIHP